MTARLGAKVIDVLEQAGERHLKKRRAPRAYAALLLQVGGTDTLRDYDASVDLLGARAGHPRHFFTSARTGRDLRAADRSGRAARAAPEFRSFLGHALAERRVQELIACAARARPRERAAPRPGRRGR